MADRIQHRRDKRATWESVNPVLLEGEIGLVLDDPNLYKVGDGTKKWNDLPYRGFNGTVAQELGTSQEAVMSQKAVTDAILPINTKLNTIFPGFHSSKGDFIIMDEAGNIVQKVKDGHIYVKEFNSANANSQIQILLSFQNKLFETRLVGEFAIGDEKGNHVLEVLGGHVKTKNFNSKYAAKSEDKSDGFTNFSIVDAQNNVVLRVVNGGHLRTRNFNSRDVIERISNIQRVFDTDKFSGKRFSIVGDGLSTYQGYIPSGYANAYPKDDVTDVHLTWWYSLIGELGGLLLKNCSWSGSTVTGNTSSAESAQAAASTKRIKDLANGTVTPDIVIIHIGTNDFNKEIGSFDATATIPADGESVTVFSNAYAIMVNKILKTYPNTRVFCCTLPERSESYPSKNSSSKTISEFNEQIVKIATALGADIIDMHSCGINNFNFEETTCGNDKIHPNVKGSLLMKNKARAELIAKY